MRVLIPRILIIIVADFSQGDFSHNHSHHTDFSQENFNQSHHSVGPSLSHAIHNALPFSVSAGASPITHIETVIPAIAPAFSSPALFGSRASYSSSISDVEDIDELYSQNRVLTPSGVRGSQMCEMSGAAEGEVNMSMEDVLPQNQILMENVLTQEQILNDHNVLNQVILNENVISSHLQDHI